MLLLLESGIDPASIKDRLLEPDKEEQESKTELDLTPLIEVIDSEEATAMYKEAVSNALHQAHENSYAHTKAVQENIRQLIDKVVIYPSNDPQGRDVEMTGDLERLITPDPIGMKAMVPGGGIEPPTRGFSNGLAIRVFCLRIAHPVA